MVNESERSISTRETLSAVLSGRSDAGIRFSELCALLRALGFEERVRGSHHIFAKEGVRDILNLQPNNGMAKRYQVRQVRRLIQRERLRLE